MKTLLAILYLYSCPVSAVITRPLERFQGKDKLTIIGSEFYQRSQFDSGEIRIFLKNAGKEPLSISECKLRRILSDKDGNSNDRVVEINYLYSKLSPPVLMPGQNGELLIKLLKAPSGNDELESTIHDNTGNIFQTTILIEKEPVWVPYVGFSEDLSKVYVYVQNNTQNSLRIQLIKVAGVDAFNEHQSINNNLPPGDKGCLIFDMPTPLILGEYVHVVISAALEDQKWQTRRIVRAINKFPLLFEESSGGIEFGLDSERFFIASTSPTNEVACIQSMICPAHAHGTHETAAREFLDSYHSIFAQNPYLLMQMRICRVDKPRAWYKFGALPDVAVMNPILLIDQAHKSEIKASQQFNPFFWLANTAKKTVEPNRYLAFILLYPENSEFLQSSHTTDEIKFLVYCAIASGAKGILYRGKPASDQLSRDGFIRLNKELQQLKPLLIIGEPVNWSSTANDNYIAKSLLCGDEAILVMVFDNRYFGEQKDNRLFTPNFEKGVNPVKIEIAIPYGTKICDVKPIYRPLSYELWNYRNGQLDFTANMVDSVQVYKLILERGDN